MEHQTLGQWDDHPIYPAFQHIILKISGDKGFKYFLASEGQKTEFFKKSMQNFFDQNLNSSLKMEIKVVHESHKEFLNLSELIPILVYFITLCPGWPYPVHEKHFFFRRWKMMILYSLSVASSEAPTSQKCKNILNSLSPGYKYLMGHLILYPSHEFFTTSITILSFSITQL